MMRNKYNALLAALTILAAATGCKVTEMEKAARSEKLYPVHFVAEEIETRTVFGDANTSGGSTSYPTLWTVNDSKVAVSLNLNGFRGATVNPAEDFKSATFDAEFPESEVSAPYEFYALSPFSAAVGASSNRGGWHFNIPAEQVPLEGSCDEAAQVLVASSESESIEAFSSVEFHFSHLTAYGKLTLKEISQITGDIQSVDITASIPLSGRYYYSYEDGSLEESSASHTVTLRPTVFAEEGAANSCDLWFACAPGEFETDGTIRIDVNGARGVWSRTVTIPAGKLAFKAGRVSKFSVNMGNAEFTEKADRWVLVTDGSTLSDGDEIIIANAATAGSAYAISTTDNGNYRGYTSVDIVKDGGDMVIQNPGSTVEHLILVAGTGNHSSCFRLKDATDAAEKYLSATNSGNNNYLQTADNDNDYDNWVITITNQQLAVISTYGTVRSGWSTYYRQIRFNSDRFATYRSSSRTSWDSTTTGTKGTYIFRKEAGVNIDDDPILEQEVYGAYLSGNNNVYEAGDQLSREYMNDGTVTFAIFTPATYEIAEFNGIPVDPVKGDTFTLNYNLITGRNQSDTDYNVTVVKVDGPKVWLSAGGNRGFIVKK